MPFFSVFLGICVIPIIHSWHRLHCVSLSGHQLVCHMQYTLKTHACFPVHVLFDRCHQNTRESPVSGGVRGGRVGLLDSHENTMHTSISECCLFPVSATFSCHACLACVDCSHTRTRCILLSLSAACSLFQPPFMSCMPSLCRLFPVRPCPHCRRRDAAVSLTSLVTSKRSSGTVSVQRPVLMLMCQQYLRVTKAVPLMLSFQA
jgi:hypothetical protein